MQKMGVLVQMIQATSATATATITSDAGGHGSTGSCGRAGGDQSRARAIRRIFLNVETLVGVNKVLLAGLQALAPTSGFKYGSGAEEMATDHCGTFVEQCLLWTDVSQLFSKTWPFFRVYSEYAVGHAARKVGVGAILEGQAELKEFLFAKQGWNASTLEAELIKPVQRILKYSLFLREALQNVERCAGVQNIEQGADSNIVLNAMSSLEKALVMVDRVSAEVNEALSRSERSHEILELWERMGRRPGTFLQPGRQLLHVCVVTCAPGMDTQKNGVAYGKRKEYLLAVLSDILVFARPNGNRHSVATDNGADRDGDTWSLAPFDPEQDSPSHHPKHLTRIEHLDVSSSVYSSTQPRGKCGLDVRVLGKPDTTQGESPYRYFAVWCETPNARDVLREKIQGALQDHLYAFFSRRSAQPIF